jgi:hypothetical protein
MTLVLAMSAPNAICMAVDYRDKRGAFDDFPAAFGSA